MLTNQTTSEMSILSTNYEAGESDSVSSHGSAKDSTTANDFANGNNAFYNNRYPKYGSLNRYRGEPPEIRIERSRQSVESWLRDPRIEKYDRSGLGDEDEMLKPISRMAGSTMAKEGLPTFDLCKKDIALSQSFQTRPSSPSPWTSNKDRMARPKQFAQFAPFPRKSNRIPVRNFQYANLDEETSPAFKNFIDQFKAAVQSTDCEPEETPRIYDPFRVAASRTYSASCPLTLYPEYEPITCDLSAASSRKFWEEKMALYKVQQEEQEAEAKAKKNFEEDLLGTNGNRGDDTYEDLPVTEDKSIDKAFLTTIPDEGGKKGEETDSNDGKSSGYVGSGGDEAKSVKSESDSSFSSKNEAKLCRQGIGRRRRCTSTPLSSPEKPRRPPSDYETMLSSLMPPPPPPLNTHYNKNAAL